jgi:thiol-disulfide isomerase/thioredoxin
VGLHSTALRRCRRAVALLTALAATVLLLAAPAAADDPPTLLYFGTENCPFCRAMQPFLDQLEADYPGLVVARYDVSDQGHAAIWEREMAARGEQAQGVPTAILADRVWVGFTEAIGQDIEAAVARTPGVDDPSSAAADVPDAASGPPLPAIVIGVVVVLAVAVALFAPRRGSTNETD